MPLDTPPLIASAFDARYLIQREIGSGGMAIVYLARDRKLDRDVALKILRPELGAVLGSERFLTEIKISARLDHPHILTLIDSGNADGFLYYVMPYVRGESLRSKLDREHQLPLDETVRIATHVASALDYAHREGLVHRDIKPENILIQEGEAMLTDFGIALAVREAGGNRLTQTGLSLGTPQYMSPEQATGDRGIDARSDVYSLAAVLYEMLAGEPPVSGASAQSMIAKLLTEKPTRLRVLRDSVPEHFDDAVSKALSRTPADRYASAGEFVRALSLPTGTTTRSQARPQRRRGIVYALAAAAALVLVIAAVMLAGKFRRQPRATLGDRIQLTTSGAIRIPAVSGDGKQLAYATRDCAVGGCRYSVIVQDIGRSSARTILEGATTGNGLEWSPDQRNLLFYGTISGQTGNWLISTLGAAPRFIGRGAVTFTGDGDSLLIAPPDHADSTFWIRVAPLDGSARDSIRVTGKGRALTSISVIPGTNWILTLIPQPPKGLWQVIGRDGKVADHVVNACTCGGSATSDAVWLARAGEGQGEAIVRIAIDRSSGHLSAQQDTMIKAQFTGFSITRDGGVVVMDVGTYDTSIWSLNFQDLVHGKFPESRRVLHASSGLYATISPDGSRLLVQRSIPRPGGANADVGYSVMPFTGGQESPLRLPGNPRWVWWSDSVTFLAADNVNGRLHVSLMDIATGARRNQMDVPDTVGAAMTPVAGGWAWTNGNDSLFIRQNGRMRVFSKPPRYRRYDDIVAGVPGNRVFTWGRDSTGDSLIVSVFDPRDGSSTEWATLFGLYGNVVPLADGTAALIISETQGSLTLIRLKAPHETQKMWISPGDLAQLTLSQDLKHVTAMKIDYRSDAWMSKVVRQ